MSPAEIAIFGRAFQLGIEAERDRTRARGKALLAEADAMAAELEDIRIEVQRLEALTAAEPERPGALH